MSKKGFTYTLQIDAEINDLIAKANIVKKSMESIMSAGKAPGAEKIFGSIEKAIDRLQTKASQPIESVAAFANLQKDAAAVGVSLGKLSSIIDNLGNMDVADKMDLLPPNLKKQIEDASAALVAFSKAQAQAAQKTQALIDAENDLAAAQKELKKAEGRVQEKQALIQAQKALVDSAHDEADAIKAKIDALKKYQATAAAYEAAGGDKRKAGGGKEELAGLNLPADRMAAKKAVPGLELGNAQAVADEITRLGDAYSQASKAVTDAESTQRRYSKQLNEANNTAAVASGKVAALQQSVTQLNQEFEKNKAKDIQAAYTKLRTEAEKLGVDLSNIPVDYAEQNFIELNNAMNQLAADGIADIDAGLDTIQNEMEETGVSAGILGNKMAEASRDVQTLDTQVSQTQAFAQRIAQFVGLQGGIEIARSAMRNAISTIKELDEAMTEMAVVTDLGVGDYWDQLPEYTARANALGVSIKSAYESATLYYQQGLKTNEVVAMSNETLKMARIASLSAEDATNKMTAALRGFNMELNETSAQRISDVYSELAAITASDVDEISSAMTKTASIAASAGMEFETTAAFLSQIIETTRESAETAGTAMKTVIARFQELKKDPAEIGEVDGEVVDANKIETALRSVGVALRDTSGQFRDLDDVFLELSSKWDSLDTNTQRYIATIAAGSRQQSRFIAMMSDYSRTQELVTAANTSAGASNEQFEKTMDSLESKLNELKNAWDSFTMDIMDSDLLKAGVDLLTKILTVINNITDALGDFGGAAKIGILVAALYLGDKALKVFLASVQKGSGLFGSLGAAATGTFKEVGKDVDTLKKKFSEFTVKIQLARERMQNLATPQQRSAIEAYTSAITRQTKAQTTLQTLEKQGITSGSEYALAKAMQTQSTMDLGIATNRLQRVFNLTDNEMQEANALVAAGISLDKAAILVKNEKAMAILREKGALDSLNDEASKNLVLEQADKLLSGTDNVDGFTNSLENLGKKLQNFDLKTWFESTSAGLRSVGEGFLNAARSVLSFLASIWPLLLLLALLAGAIALLVLYIKHLNKTSPEGKLKSAKKAAEAAGEAADAAAESYNSLKESLESLEDKYKGLEELTKGTEAWRDAVRSINEEVLNLITEYPELAGMFENVDGVLTIKAGMEDDVEGVLRDKEMQASKASSAELAAKMSVARAENDVAYKNLSKGAKYGNQDAQDAILWSAVGGGALAGAAGGAAGGAALGTVAPGIGNAIGAVIGGILGGLAGGISAGVGAHAAVSAAQAGTKKSDQDYTEAIAKAMASGEIDNPADKEQLSQWIQENLDIVPEAADKMAKELSQNTTELIEFGKALNGTEQQTKAFYEAMAQNAVLMVDTSKMTEEEQKQVNIAANADYAKIFKEQAQNTINAETADMSKNEYKDYATKEAKELYGTDEVSVDSKGNITINSGDEEQTISREEFESQLAAAKSTENAAQALENLPKAIDKVAGKMGEAGKAFERSYTAKEGKAMTRGDIESLKSYSNTELENVYNSLSATEQQAFGSYENFQKHIQDSIKLGEEAFNTASNVLDQMGAVVKYNEKMTGETAQGYADQLEYIMQGAGQAGVDQVNNALNNLASSMNDEELNKFMGQLNALDWKNMDSWEELPDLLKEVGLSVPDTELEKFIQVASDTAGAVKSIDLEALNEQMLNLQSLSSKIKSGEQGRNISSGDYEALIAAVPDLAGKFQQTLDGEFVYLGGSMDKLTAAISDNTDALLQQTTKQLQNKVDAAELMQDMAARWSWSDGTKADIRKWKSWKDDSSTSNAIGYLSSFISEADKSGMDLSQLGIAGLSNDTDVTEMTEKQINAMMNSLVGVFNDFEKNSTLLMEKTVNALSLSYQNRDATSNSMEATKYRNIIAKGGQLNEDQQIAMKASINAVTSQAVVAGVNDIDISKYTNMIANMEAVQQSYKRGEISLKQFKQQYASFAKEAEAFERKVVNKTNLNKMNASLQSTVETVGELSERFDKLKDKSTKIETVAKMVEQFGIQVNESNYQVIGQLATTMAAGGEAGYAAFERLIAQAGKAYGLTLNQIANMSMSTWNDSTHKMSSDMQAFADSMVASGTAMWQEMADGSKKFVWATQNTLLDAIDAAGTAIDTWENPYDELYNLNHKLNAAIREREKLERNYERAVEDSSKSAQDLADITAQELASLKEEAKVQKDIAQAALKNIETERSENTQYSRYYTYDTKTNTIQVDWKAVDKAGWNADEGDEFKEFISYLEEQADTAKEAQDALEDIEDSVDEIQKRGRDNTSEIYNQVKEGLIKERQEQIDKLQSINDAIQEAQSALVDQMQKQIDEARQARDNEKTENEIADKEARLAYLMRDTSGGNAMEIASLQKEIDEAKQGYTDSLVDQQLQSLQDVNEKAAEQRQEQIDLAQMQLDSYANSAEIWSEVKELVDAGFTQVANGIPFVETQAGQLAALSKDVSAMNPFEAKDFTIELNNAAKEGTIYQGFVKITGEDGATTISDLAESITEDIATLKANSEKAADKDTRPVVKDIEPILLQGDASNMAKSTINFGKYSISIPDNMKRLHLAMGKAYATGGLADYTGTAWLDGTKSRPEIVLNQTDSANFMQLRDILADILQGTSDLSRTSGKTKDGDNYFDIEINVDSINDDYDVEQLADKIRDMIYGDAIYRNVNAVSTR